ncbi:MAG: DsbA family oxidoreductase [Robiginitomaculum sp.]
MAKKKTKNPTSPVHVDIVSDIVCPWCWLGKAYFDEAVRKSGRKVEVTYRPYMLDPDIAMEGVPYAGYLTKKFGAGARDKFKPMRERLEQAASGAGIEFKFDDIPVRPNTLRAHMLIRWAQEQGFGPAAAEALFRAFFKALRDIGDVETLGEIAGEIGMDGALTMELLRDNKDADSVREEILYFRGLGISGVPTFIYNGQFAVQGGQPVSAHLDAIKQAASQAPLEDM